METNVKVLGWLYIVFSILGIILAAFILGIMILSGALSGDRNAFAIVTIIGLIVSGFVTLLSLPGLAAGWGLLQFRNWARILALVIGVLGLTNVPFGTALGIYALVVLLNEETARLFH